MTVKNSLDSLENFKNTGTLDVQALTMNGTDLVSGSAGTVTASNAVVVDANKDIASFRNVGATGTLTVATVDASAGIYFSFAAITAGTTQTQAGATAITTDIVQVTTANSSDGVILPAGSAAQIGRTIRIINASANGGVVYCPGATNTNTINGTAGATGVAYAASKTLTCILVSATAWVTTLSN